MSLKDLKVTLTEAVLSYQTLSAQNQAELSKRSDAVKAARKAISACITEGAVPCPDCKVPPHGMEQPAGKDRIEFEVGCPCCPRRVRGGLLPRHAVEAWNEACSE